MRTALALALLTACDRSPARAVDAGEDGGAVVVVPGHRIGPLQVGMDRRALSRQHLPITLYDGGTDRLRAGPYELRFNPQGRVDRVSLPLRRAPEGVRLDGTTLPASADVDRVVSEAPGCTPAVPVDGVATWRCAGGGLLVQVEGDALVLSVTHALDAGS
ncbi:MAG: hypothetical protein U0325_07875 [Polyangiales bacterium]